MLICLQYLHVLVDIIVFVNHFSMVSIENTIAVNVHIMVVAVQSSIKRRAHAAVLTKVHTYRSKNHKSR